VLATIGVADMGIDGEFSTSSFLVDAYLADVALQNLVVTDASKSLINKL